MTLTRHGAASAPERQPCTGPLASYVKGFVAQLSRKGYAQNTVRAKCDVLAELSRWLERRQLTLVALDEGRLKQFQATRRRRGKARRGDPATGQQLLDYLRERDDIAAAAQKIDRTPAASLTRDFGEFLHSERGLSHGQQWSPIYQSCGASLMSGSGARRCASSSCERRICTTSFFARSSV
jgi:integrase/recombinase XerD